MHHHGDRLQPYCSLVWSLGLGQGPVLVTVLDAGFESSSRRVRSLVGNAGGARPQPLWHHESRDAGARSLREAWRSCCPFPACESGCRPARELEASEWEKVGQASSKEQGKEQRFGVRRPSLKAATWELWGLRQTTSPLWAQIPRRLLYSHGQTSPQHGIILSPRESLC